MSRIGALLRFICPNYASPLPDRPWRHSASWRGIILVIVVGHFIGAVGFQLKPASFALLKTALAQIQPMVIDILNAIQSWVRSFDNVLSIIKLAIKLLTTQNAVDCLACIINHRDNPRIIHMARP
jgi:hypothetical protein